MERILKYLLGGLVLLAGCQQFAGGDPCPGGRGLKAAGYGGQAMAPKTVSLIFDGGPSSATAGIGDVLAAHGAQATFFVQGARATGATGNLARLKELGHLVGNRGYSDRALTVAPDPVSEVRKTDEVIAPYVTGEMFLLRARFDADLVERLTDAGLGRYVGPIRADLGEQADGEPQTVGCRAGGIGASDCAQRYLDAIRAAQRGIVLFDGDGAATADVLRVLLPKLTEEGYTFVRLDQVADVRVALEENGGEPGTVGGAGGCREYER